MSKAYECDRCGILFKPYKNQKTSKFLNIDYLDLCPKCNDKLQEWVENGKVQVNYTDSKEKPQAECSNTPEPDDFALTDAEKIICKMYLKDLDKTGGCNEYKLLMRLIESAKTSSESKIL